VTCATAASDALARWATNTFRVLLFAVQNEIHMKVKRTLVTGQYTVRSIRPVSKESRLQS